MQTHKDFVFLSDAIFERTHQTVGVNTLKRLWGHLEEGATPRLSTLNILAQYAGFDDWETFVASSRNYPPQPLEEQKAVASSHDVAEAPQLEAPTFQEPEQRSSSRKSFRFLAFIALFVSVLSGAGFYVRSVRQQVAQLQDSLQCVQEKKYILHSGQTFTAYDDYLSLFGLKDVKEYPYFQIHPHLGWLVLWGPQYHHPNWHNDGDSARLMPTITERWAPDSATPELIAMRGSELFYNGRRNNDIRLTFMKGLRPDSLFTFIGVYRFSMSQSDTTHIVWEKVADECNLQHLELLEQLRN